jgi:predicted phosphodiesterase
VIFAILSDIHGNLEALRAVLEDLKRFPVDRVVCLGDLVGYGPDPEEVVRSVRERGILSVMGNHELGLTDPGFLSWFNVPTRNSLRLTKKLISPATLDYLRSLPPFLSLSGCLFVHGCPPDSITTYLFELSPEGLEEVFKATKDRLAFVGHTHDLLLVQYDGLQVGSQPLSQGLYPLQEDRRYIVNVGSVGQPRDGNNQAKYVLYDNQQQRLEVRFLAYDISATAIKIRDRGFPETHARRLF